MRAALPGRYAMGPLTLAVRRRGKDLVADIAGTGTVTLVHTGGARFGTADIPSAVLDVVFTAEAGVTQLVVDPIGIFVRDAG